MKTTDFKELEHYQVLERVKNILPKITSAKGGKYILCLLENPRKQFPYIYLENCLKKDQINDFKEVHDFDILENSMRCIVNTPYYMCDAQTKNEVEKRIKQIELLENAANIDNQLLSKELQKEKQALITYLSEVLNDNGTIKKFDDGIIRPKKSVKMSVRRFLIEVNDIDPNLAKNIKYNLVKDKFTMMYFA